MKLFTPLTADQPLTYAQARPDHYRNVAREEHWGAPVFFSPASWVYDQSGSPGPYYKYGHNANEKLGKYGNCTWWCLSRHHQNCGEWETSIIGDAGATFDKYKGRKDGSLEKQIYIGDKLQPGDMLVWADNLENNGNGHINYIEKIDGNNVFISESGYSTKTCYKDKACIVYTLDKTKLTSTKRISLRPVQPYSEYLIGVIHTGDIYEKETDYKSLYEEAQAKLDEIKEIVND